MFELTIPDLYSVYAFFFAPHVCPNPRSLLIEFFHNSRLIREIEPKNY